MVSVVNSHERPIKYAAAAITAPAAAAVLVHVLRSRFPKVQPLMSCATSGLAWYCRNCCSAMKKKFMTMPARITVEGDMPRRPPSQ